MRIIEPNCAIHRKRGLFTSLILGTDTVNPTPNALLQTFLTPSSSDSSNTLIWCTKVLILTCQVAKLSNMCFRGRLVLILLYCTFWALSVSNCCFKYPKKEGGTPYRLADFVLPSQAPPQDISFDNCSFKEESCDQMASG
jgi:hypothetical protein